jgi:hypothetical protein
MQLIRWSWIGGLAVLASTVGAEEIRVEIGGASSRSTDSSWTTKTDLAVRNYNRQVARLTERERLARRITVQFSTPLRVVLTRNGAPLPIIKPSSTTRGPEDIVLAFDASGARAFPNSYQQVLADTFTQARPAMNAVFGVPKTPGTVHVKNFDADIQDRYAVAGGYYVPNAPGGPEVRFPIYNSTTAASINFVHVLLLAYQGDTPYFADAFSEGLPRAATMTIARTPGSLPNAPAADDIEAVLDSLYDATTFYDWYNQPGVGARKFIPANLLNQNLPPGGSTGGVYLLRYLMAGSVWAKALAEYPGFVAEFNKRYYATPALFDTEAELIGLGQTVINFLSGSATASIEGMSFADWYERQAILDTTTSGGSKVVVQPFPITPVSGSSDFGVFGLLIHTWKQLPSGDETLLAGKAYPIFWRPDDVRFFTSTQEDVVDIAGGFGSAAPNFPGDSFSGEVYRTTVDIPFQGQVARAYLPAGGFATGANTTQNNFYGTVTGLPTLPSGQSYRISVQWSSGTNSSIPVENFAFGVRIADTNFVRPQVLTVKVFRLQGAIVTELYSRRVNKGQGSIALDLRANADQTYTLNLANRLNFVGVPLQAYRPYASQMLNTAANQILLASYNPTVGRYDLFPDEGRLMRGMGAFIRPNAAQGAIVKGSAEPNTLMTVHLRPGFNAVTVPFNADVPFANVQVLSATESVSSFTEALGTLIGNTLFTFQPDGSNPDGGTFVPATSFKPGQAVFVRALRAEGAVLIFFPAAIPGVTSKQAASVIQPHSMGFGGGSTIGGLVKSAWEMKVTVRGAAGQTSSIFIGQRSDARSGFDPKIDAEMPPLLGGFQAIVQGDRLYYRDMRSVTAGDVFRMRFDGLRAGTSYQINFANVVGSKSLMLYDPVRQTTTTVRGNMTITFTATGATQTFEVRS